MVLNPTHALGLEWFGIPVLVAGFALLAWVVWPWTEASGAVESLGARFLHWVTWQGRLKRLFPIVGASLLSADLAYNLFLSSSPALLTEDLLVLLTAATFLGYGLVPRHYSRERDFVLLFFVILDTVLVLPLLIVRILAGSPDVSVDAYSWAALAPELSGVLSVLGVSNSVHSVSGFTAPGLTFRPLQMSSPVTVVITTACSGIYSFGIFASGYVAFLLTEYERPSRRMWTLLALGFLASYAANILRMVVIVLVGYYTDSAQTELQNLLLAHSYAGWIIFLGWLGLFWGFLFRFLPTNHGPGAEVVGTVKESPVNWQSLCRICGESLSPAIPAIRCDCSAIYHRSCIQPGEACRSCDRSLAVAPVPREALFGYPSR